MARFRECWFWLALGLFLQAGALSGQDFSKVLAWGQNTSGQTNVPPAASNVIAVAGADNHSLALRTDGTLVSWGQQTSVPVTATNVVAIAARSGKNLALRADGTLVGWGTDFFDENEIPPSATNIVAIAAGLSYNLALRIDGSVVRWGAGGIMGPNLDDFIGVAGGDISLALRANGDAQLFGPGNWFDAPYSNLIAIAAGPSDYLGITSNRSVVAWIGYGSSRGVPAAATNAVAVASGSYHQLALRADGRIISWGDNDYGQTTTPSIATNVIAISAGAVHSLAVTGGAPWVASTWLTHTTHSGKSAILIAHAVGAAPLSYEWFRDGASIGTSSRPERAFLNGLASDSGDYQVVVSNPFGAATGHVATLNFQDVTPFFLLQPTNQTVAASANVLLAAAANGSQPISFQWYSNSASVFRATNATLSLTNVQASSIGDYFVVASNAFGMTTSAVATITVTSSLPNPSVSQSTNVVAWTSTTLTTGAKGTEPIYYQWLFNGNAIPGATNLSLTITNMQPDTEGDYRTIASNVVGMRTSSVARVKLVTLLAWGNGSTGQTNIPATVSNVVSIVAGGSRNLALIRDGTVIGWGANSSPFNFTNLPPAASNLLAVATGSGHCLGLRPDGTVVVWGTTPGTFINTNVPASATNCIAIEAGSSHSLALRGDGMVIAWGGSSGGRTNVPPAATNIVGIAAGGLHSLALRSDGRVFAWGSNSENQTNVPPQATNIIAVAAGLWHSLALRNDGRVFAWGINSSGITNVPATVSNIVAIATGESHNLAIRDDGKLFSWGANSGGQTTVPAVATHIVAATGGTDHSLALIGDLNGPNWTPEIYSGKPLLLHSGAVRSRAISQQWFHDGVAIAGATNSYFYLTGAQPADGGVYTIVISNVFGVVTSQVAVVTVPNISPFVVRQPLSEAVPPRGELTLSATADGSRPLTYQWYFQGNSISNATQAHLTLSDIGPAQIGGYTVTVSNTFGMVTSVVAQVGLTPIVTWGRDDDRELHIPFGATNIQGIAAGMHHSLAWRWDGTVLAWGLNSHGQTNVPAAATNVVQVAAGYYHSLARRADGSLVAWGDNRYGQINIPSAATNITNISAGVWHNLALRADGRVIAWGQNSENQTNVPPAATNITAVAAGGYHSLALRTDGRVVAWGAGTNNIFIFPDVGQAMIPAGLSNILAISGGEASSLALRRDGTVLGLGFTATNFPGATNIVAIEAGYPNLALRTSGSVVAWEGGVATNVPALATNVVSIAAGWGHALALTSDGAPGFTLQPISQIRTAGTAVIFQVLALGAPALHYQWHKNGTNISNGGKISGALSNLLAIVNLTSEEAGIYSVTISNAIGSLTSQDATLTVLTPPSLGLQPISQRVPLSNGVSFSVSASGTEPLFYRWRFKNVTIQGATNSVYSVAQVATNHAGNYHVVVTNMAGAVTSSNAWLTVLVPPTLGLQVSNGVPQLALSAGLSNTIILQSTTNLASANWQDLMVLSNATIGPHQFVDPAGFVPMRFYRALVR